MHAAIKFFALATTLSLTVLSYADSEESAVVNSRSLSEKTQEKMAQDRQAEWEEMQQNLVDPLSVLLIPIKGCHYAALSSPSAQVTEAEYSLYRFHWIQSFSTCGGILYLEDGSEWSLDKTSGSTVAGWKPNDIVEITPRQPLPWGSNYAYVITNKDLNSGVYATVTGPIRKGSSTSWVCALNRHSLTVNLISGEGARSAWEIAPSDAEIFQEWRHDDIIITGYNNSWLWWFSSFDHILINVNLQAFVRAKTANSL